MKIINVRTSTLSLIFPELSGTFTTLVNIMMLCYRRHCWLAYTAVKKGLS